MLTGLEVQEEEEEEKQEKEERRTKSRQELRIVAVRIETLKPNLTTQSRQKAREMVLKCNETTKGGRQNEKRRMRK